MKMEVHVFDDGGLCTAVLTRGGTVVYHPIFSEHGSHVAEMLNPFYLRGELTREGYHFSIPTFSIPGTEISDLGNLDEKGQENFKKHSIAFLESYNAFASARA